MIRLFMAVAAVGLLAGCGAPGLEVARVTDIRPSNKAAGLDVYAERRRAGDKVPDFSGDQLVDVRSYREREESGYSDEEFAGAKCAVKARDYAADVVTPARIRVPLYRQESSPLSVSCQHPDYQPRSIVLDVYNKTKQDNYAAASGNGLVGLLVMAAINEMSDEKGHTFAYPIARLVMKPVPKGGKARRDKQ
jgi:hypothetical protein